MTPSPTTTFSVYGVTDFQLQYWSGTQWVAIPGAAVTSNRLVWRQLTFAPITTTGIRVVVSGALASYSRIAELEAYSAATAPTPPPPTAGVNVALAANGGVASSSSVYGPGYTASGAINGDRTGASWGAGGGWADGTYNAYPDWLQVDFAGAKTITEVDVFSIQDVSWAPVTPSPTTTFSVYGVTDFQLQYWSGTQWVAIPGAAVTGNRLVWRQLTFAPITTTGIRVVVSGALASYSRIAELEAYSSATETALIGFPGDNWWNLDISKALLDPNSANYIAFIGSTRRLHPDFGGDYSPGSEQIYGMPYVVVDSSVSKKTVQFVYASESDGVDHTTNQSFPFYPIPNEAVTQPHLLEGGQPGNVDLRYCCDRHLLIVDKDNRYLYELWNVFYDGVQWYAGSGAFFDMKTNNRRTDGWTSADAAGLAILPGLIRYDEAFGSSEISHAMRVTVRATNNYVFPASHRAGATVGALPMGARLRLKPTTNISGFTPEIQRIFRAMMRYGLIVADNGTDMFISGAYDARWSNDVLNPAFGALTANDFEVITLGYK